MKVVFLAGSSELGGAERSLIDLVAGLREASPSWSLSVILPGRGPLKAELEAIPVGTSIIEQPARLARLGDAGVEAGSIPRWKRLSIQAGRYAGALVPTALYCVRLRRALVRLDPDIVHTNGFKPHLLGAFAAPPRAAVVWHVRDFVSSRPMMRRLLGAVATRCHVAIANSDAVAADVRSVLPALRVQRVYNGIDTERFRPDARAMDIDAAAGFPPPSTDVVRVGLVSTFARWKGHETFLRALAALPAELSVRGYIVGGALYATDGSQFALDELRELARRCGVAPDRLGFTGHVADPASAIRALDIVVHASTQPEPFGRVIAEAMASRRAVLAAEAGGAAEVISDIPDAGYRAGDWQALSVRIDTLCRDRVARENLAERGYRSARTRFDRRQIPSQISPIYQSVVKTGHSLAADR